jgi:hypothetical protein
VKCIYILPYRHIVLTKVQLPANPLHRDHDSPCTKRLRSNFVVMISPIINLVLGQKRPSRNVGGTQNKSSEFEPNIQPSCITELSMNGGKTWVTPWAMNLVRNTIAF